MSCAVGLKRLMMARSRWRPASSSRGLRDVAQALVLLGATGVVLDVELNCSLTVLVDFVRRAAPEELAAIHVQVDHALRARREVRAARAGLAIQQMRECEGAEWAAVVLPGDRPESCCPHAQVPGTAGGAGAGVGARAATAATGHRVMVKAPW